VVWSLSDGTSVLNVFSVVCNCRFVLSVGVNCFECSVLNAGSIGAESYSVSPKKLFRASGRMKIVFRSKRKLMLKSSLNLWAVFGLLGHKFPNFGRSLIWWAKFDLASELSRVKNGVVLNLGKDFWEKCFLGQTFEKSDFQGSSIRNNIDTWVINRTFILHPRSLGFKWSSNYKLLKFRDSKNRIPKNQSQSLLWEHHVSTSSHNMRDQKHLNTNNQSWRLASRG
jgi:hypothetical protein